MNGAPSGKSTVLRATKRRGHSGPLRISGAAAYVDVAQNMEHSAGVLSCMINLLRAPCFQAFRTLLPYRGAKVGLGRRGRHS